MVHCLDKLMQDFPGCPTLRQASQYLAQSWFQYYRPTMLRDALHNSLRLGNSRLQQRDASVTAAKWVVWWPR